MFDFSGVEFSFSAVRGGNWIVVEVDKFVEP